MSDVTKDPELAARVHMRKSIAIACLYLTSSTLAINLYINSLFTERGINQADPEPDNVQLPLSPGLALPEMPEPENNSGRADDGLTISDILPKTRNINIFASLTRDISSVSGRLESAGENSTLLAPLNSVMQNLPRKPWEDRPDDTSPVSAANNEDKAAENLQRFVNEHIVPMSPWNPGKEHKIKTIGGQVLWWEERNGKKVILPGEVVVDSVVGRVGNGEVWALKGVINYA